MTHASQTQLVLDLTGVAVFALSGAVTGVRRDLDLFGILVLANVAALGGGLVRDVLLGATPPAGLQDWRYVTTATVAGGLAAVFHPAVTRGEPALVLLDAAGLGLFVTAGTVKALEHGLGPLPSALLGMVTGIGGGVLRDLLVGDVPVVLRRELYAVPALLGALAVSLAWKGGAHGGGVAIAAAVAITVLRLLAVRFDWHAPHARDV